MTNLQGAATVSSYVYTYDDNAIASPNSKPTAHDQRGRIYLLAFSTAANTYDDNGNRLTQVEANGAAAQTTSYDYDENDRLTVVTYPDKTTTYPYDAAYNREAEVTVVTATSTTETNKTYAYNDRNQLTGITDRLDAANNVTYDYDAFGNIRSEAGDSYNRFTFTCHDNDEETGLFYFKARFYDPDTGRFLNADPYLGEIGTPSLFRIPSG